MMCLFKEGLLEDYSISLITLSNIAYDVHKFSQYMASPRYSHLQTANMVLKSLNTLSQGLFVFSTSKNNLTTFFDAD